MTRLWLHFRRYSAWSMFGILICVWAVLPFRHLREDATFMLRLICSGGSSFVHLRAAVGIATGWPPGKADRATAKAIGLFFIGSILTLLLGSLVLIDGRVNQLVGRWVPSLHRHPIAVIIVIGGLTLVATGWLTRGKRDWLFLPVAWLAVFAASLIVLLALSR